MVAEKIYLKPKTAEEAIRAATENENDFRYVAGGTDVLVNKFQGNEDASCLIDITGIEDMKKIFIEDDVLKIGSLVRLDDLQKHEVIRNNFPALPEAAHSAASPMLRKTATLGGNILCENRCTFYNQSEFWRVSVGFCLKCEGDICIATGSKKSCYSKFVADTVPVLISMNAQLEIAGKDGNNKVDLQSIYTGDGINPRNLSKTSIIKYIVLPLNQKYNCVFKKLRPRESVDFTSLTTALSLNRSGEIKIVLGGVDPKPIVVQGTLSDKKELIKQAVKKARIIDNDFYPRLYRKEMITVFLERSFAELKIEC
jgi:4-hydroxybenzoyl-CoA reductase subunit beta